MDGYFTSIYNLQNGLDLTGQYYSEQTTLFNNNTDLFYNGNHLYAVRGSFGNPYLRDYNGQYLINNVTNNAEQNNQVSNYYNRSTGILKINIDEENINFPPIAESQEVSTDENTAIEITLVATDENGDDLSYSITVDPTNGSISINGNIVTYTPNETYFGTDIFRFVANDGEQNSNTATVTINVSCIQQTYIPDDVFEEHIISLGLDDTWLL